MKQELKMPNNQNILKGEGYSIKVLDHGFVRYIDHMGSDRSIANTARISHGSEAKTIEDDKRLIKYLFRNKHSSPFEFGKIVFHIKLPIFVMRQYVRHRMQNMNEESARYRELSNDFYIPEKWRKQDNKNKQGSLEALDWNQQPDFETPSINQRLSFDFNSMSQNAYIEYEKMLKEGVAREMARMVLPVNIYTEAIVCWDMNNLIKYLLLRADNHAQWEHVQYANAIKNITRQLFPWTVECMNEMLKDKELFNEWKKIQNDGK